MSIAYWLPTPEEHDYPAAASYLLLLMPSHTVDSLVARLRSTPISHFKAKDIFRAAQLPRLGTENKHVKHHLNKILAGELLSPILLVRAAFQNPLIIADGYHRLCAVYIHDEDQLIPCKII